MENAAEQLKKIPFVRGLPETAIQEMAAHVTTHTLAKDEVLFGKGEPGDSIYMLRTGWVKIVTEDTDGDELVLNHCGPGEVVGEMSLIDEEPRSAGVVTLSPVTVMELKRDVFMDVLKQEPMLALDVMRNFSARLRFATTYIEQAIEWSHRIAEGDYGFALNQIQSAQSGVVDPGKADDVRATELLSAFFQMIEGVRRREENLKQQLRQLSIEIDESRRKEEVESVMQSEFFRDLQSSVKRMRQQNDDNEE